MKTQIAAVRYHEDTKHHPGRMARSPGFMDWANQPNPFRRFDGAPFIPLRLGAGVAEDVSYDQLLLGDLPPPAPVTLDAVSDLLAHSLAISAWKAFGGTRWALRINPSSGNLHPTEGYLILDAVEGISGAPGVYHYAPKDHALESRCSFSSAVWNQLVSGFPAGTFFAGLSSIHWREAWKYGERAYRYCQHDVGHAFAAISLAAALQGRLALWLADLSDGDLSSLLGLDREGDFENAEDEHPDLLLAVMPASACATSLPGTVHPNAVAGVAGANWYGRANRLSNDHVRWPLIADMEAACRKTTGSAVEVRTTPEVRAEATLHRDRGVSARQIIKQRRSAVDMDGRTGMSSGTFFATLNRTLPDPNRRPWWSLNDKPRIHLCLFVHRVEDVPPGLYLIVRAMDMLEDLRQHLDSRFTWNQPAGCPVGLALFELSLGDFRRTAGEVSCGQAIAADGAFSVGMIAEFDNPLHRHGDWYYRRLFWEAGAIGQVLYLEAENAGLRGTGIGCFFDDEVHRLLGIHDSAYQSLYHFTIGGPLEDTRLTTLPPYSPANRSR